MKDTNQVSLSHPPSPILPTNTFFFLKEQLTLSWDVLSTIFTRGIKISELEWNKFVIKFEYQKLYLSANEQIMKN
jgi:hypothetical protein